MDQLVTTGENFLKMMQLGLFISAAIAFCIAAYLFIWGGQRGRETGKGWIIGSIIGFILGIGATVLMEAIKSNTAF